MQKGQEPPHPQPPSPNPLPFHPSQKKINSRNVGKNLFRSKKGEKEKRRITQKWNKRARNIQRKILQEEEEEGERGGCSKRGLTFA